MSRHSTARTIPKISRRFLFMNRVVDSPVRSRGKVNERRGAVKLWLQKLVSRRGYLRKDKPLRRTGANCASEGIVVVTRPFSGLLWSKTRRLDGSFRAQKMRRRKSTSLGL